MSQLHPGAIILVHISTSARNTVAALDRIIPAIKSKGYRFALLSQMLGRPTLPVTKPNPSTGSGSTPTTNSTYTVKSGDTLSKIARQFNTTVAKIAQANKIQNVNFIRVGQKLLIPGNVAAAPKPAPAKPAQNARTYTVKSGDTLSKIAGQFNTTVSRIASANNIKNVNFIRVGQVLKIQ